MSKILVPIADHKYLTAAHKALIEFAKTLGEPVVTIILGLREWNQWLRDGTLGYDPVVGVVKTKEDMFPPIEERQLQEVRDMGVTDIEVVSPNLVSDSDRDQLYKEAKSLVDLYADQIILYRYYLLAISSVMRRWCRDKVRNLGADVEYVVRGPELTAFFMKHVGRLFGSLPHVIMPEMVKDPDTKVRSQFTMERVPPRYMDIIFELHPVYLSFKDRMKIGSNSELVKEVNNSYKSKKWELIDTTIWEGGIVEGRLQIASFRVMIDDRGGGIIIEDADYYA